MTICNFYLDNEKEIIHYDNNNIEEALFVLWELTPKNPDYKKDFENQKYTIFEYYGVEPAKVTKIRNDKYVVRAL